MSAPAGSIDIAFDVDGTLRDDSRPEAVVANEKIRELLITLSAMPGTFIHVWSLRGKAYAAECGHHLCIDEYVDEYAAKPDADGDHMDITFDNDVITYGTVNILTGLRDG